MHVTTFARSLFASLVALLGACGGNEPEPATSARTDAPAASTASAAAPAPAAAKKPNIVLISIDTLRADALEPWGAARPTSPNISALAKDAWVFKNTFSQAGVTAPSHMTLLTSLYPIVHGVSNLRAIEMQREGGEEENTTATRVDPKVQTLASVLSKHGWKTAAFTGGGNVCSDLGFDQGFHEFDDEPTNGVSGNDGPWFDAQHVAKWIEAHKAEPFFLFVHTWIPHNPYLPPEPWNTAFDPDYKGKIVSSRAEYDARPDADDPHLPSRVMLEFDRKDPAEVAHIRALYDGDVRYADESVGNLLAALESSGVQDDTIIVLVSDHGEQFLEHGNFLHPSELWRELVHVPLIVRLPSRESRTIETPARLIDVLPTILDLVDVPVPAEAQGRSLLPAVAGTYEELPIISEIVTRWRFSGTSRSVSRMIRSIRLAQWTYIVRTIGPSQSEELYDRSTDPGETQNLAPKRKEHLATLQRFREIARQHEEACAELAARFAGTQAQISDETLKEIGKLGYVK